MKKTFLMLFLAAAACGAGVESRPDVSEHAATPATVSTIEAMLPESIGSLRMASKVVSPETRELNVHLAIEAMAVYGKGEVVITIHHSNKKTLPYSLVNNLIFIGSMRNASMEREVTSNPWGTYIRASYLQAGFKEEYALLNNRLLLKLVVRQDEETGKLPSLLQLMKLSGASAPASESGS